MTLDTLVVPALGSTTGGHLADAAQRRGMRVEHLAAPRIPPELRADGTGGSARYLYAGPRFAGAVSRDLGVALLQPPAGWLAGLPAELLRRTVTATTLGAARGLPGPVFVKSSATRQIPARVYDDGADLPIAGEQTAVLVSDPVTFRSEYRIFLLDGAVHTGSRYAVGGVADPAPLADCDQREGVLGFVKEVLHSQGESLPGAVVLDVGELAGPDGHRPCWAVVDAGVAWHGSAYAADIDRVLDVVLRAAGPADRVAARDRRFVR